MTTGPEDEGFTRKLFGDKGYISQELFETLFAGGIHLPTKLRKNMKTNLLTPHGRCYFAAQKSYLGDNYRSAQKYLPDWAFAPSKSQKLFDRVNCLQLYRKKPNLKTTYVDTNQLLFF